MYTKLYRVKNRGSFYGTKKMSPSPILQLNTLFHFDIEQKNNKINGRY